MNDKQRAYYFRVTLYHDYLTRHPLYSKESANQLSAHLLGALNKGIIDDGRFFELLALSDYRRVGVFNLEYHNRIQKCNCPQAWKAWRDIEVGTKITKLSEKYISVIRSMLHDKQDMKNLIDNHNLGPQLPDYIYIIEDRTYIFSILELAEDLNKNCNRYTGKSFEDPELRTKYLC